MLLVLVLFLFGFAKSKNEQKKVHDTAIYFEEGDNLYVSYQTVNKLLIQNGESVKKLPKSMVDLHHLEKAVLAHPMVENATVFLTVDGVLKTKIKQRTPIARVLTAKESFYIDRQAKKMPLSTNHSARVLLVKGKVTDKNIKKVHQLVQTINADMFLQKQIVAVKVLPNDVFILEVRQGSHKIILGTINNLSHKLHNLKSFYKKTILDGTIAKYKTVNLKFQNQVVGIKK